MPSKKVLFVIACMKGGGAERIVIALSNQMKKFGTDVKIMLTNQRAEDAFRRDLDDSIELLSLESMTEKADALTTARYALSGIKSRIECAAIEKLGKPMTAKAAYQSFMWQNYGKVAALRNYLQNNADTAVIAFLQPSIPMVMLAAQGLPNRIIFSERGNSERLMKGRYGYAFAERFYQRADAAVFQSEGAMQPYPENIRAKGTVIFNPISAELPQPHIGERQKVIVNFCRIAKQKNLPLLLEAFEKFYREHNDYKLLIIGDAYTDSEKELKNQLEQFVLEKGIADAVSILPFMSNVHEHIKDFAMFVSSSDYEGMSNSMLEAMAIGLPCVCTDCPAGGARAVIKNGENGLLVPVGDADALFGAMKEVAESSALAQKLSMGGIKLRESLKLQNITKQWMSLL